MTVVITFKCSCIATLAQSSLMLKAAALFFLLNSVFLPFLQQVEIQQPDWCEHFFQVFLGSLWGLCNIHANLGFGELSRITQFELSCKSNQLPVICSSKVEPWKVSRASLCWGEELQFPLHDKCLLCLGLPFLPPPHWDLGGKPAFLEAAVWGKNWL